MICLAALVHDVLDAVRRELAAFDTLDWVLLGSAATAIALSWRWQLARVRIGTVKVVSNPSDGDGAIAPQQISAISEALCLTGLTSPGPVPGGSPKADIVAAVAAAPLSQAQWLSALLNVIPFPASTTSFEVNVTAREDGPAPDICGISYCLANLTSQQAVNVVTVWGQTIDKAVPATADAIYREVGQYAQDVFPRWAVWPDPESLTNYRDGLKCDKQQQFAEALAYYSLARSLAPNNMLVRMRIGNNADRQSSSPLLGAEERCSRALEAIDCYLGVCAREPSIYHAHYRASVLLGIMSDRLEMWERGATSADSPAPKPGELQQIWKQLRDVLATYNASFADSAEPAVVIDEGRRQSKEHSRQAGRLLRPWWTLVHEARLRHRYELKGAQRRQARKARAISKLCLELRRQPFDGKPEDVKWGFYGLRRLCLRSWVRWRHFFLRWGTSGWQAHYNAACFYALMPEAVGIKGSEYWPDTGWLRRRSLKHLMYAVSSAGEQLQARYVRYVDPDLASLRETPSWDRTMDNLYGEEVVIHYRKDSRPQYAKSRLHVTGPAVASSPSADIDDGLQPAVVTDHEALFLVPVSEWNAKLTFRVRTGNRDDLSHTFLVHQTGRRAAWITYGERGLRVKAWS